MIIYEEKKQPSRLRSCNHIILNNCAGLCTTGLNELEPTMIRKGGDFIRVSKVTFSYSTVSYEILPLITFISSKREELKLPRA